MGKKCPKCGSSDTFASGPNKMLCNFCAHSWRPYKHAGKKMKVVGDGIISERKRIMPGAKTERVGDSFVFPKKSKKK